MTLRPATVTELSDIVQAHPRVRLQGAGTKPSLAPPRRDAVTVDLTALAGMLEHSPEECTFTALAGTRVEDIERQLAGHGQYLPFDPPLAGAGATIGGTVAAGVNGPGRYRYGGVRDFLIGARIVDGQGRIVRSGGKVVKNAAGFLLHQAMVGSCGRFGAIAELTFKVFPRPAVLATVRVRAADVRAALDLMASLQQARFELDAVDIEGPSTLMVRLGGAVPAMEPRLEGVRRLLGRAAEVLRGPADEEAWRQARELAWVPSAALLARVPVTPPRIPALDDLLARSEAARRYAVGGNVAFIAWTAGADALSGALAALGLTGQVLRGESDRAIVGAVSVSEFERRVRQVMDPDGRYAGD